MRVLLFTSLVLLCWPAFSFFHFEPGIGYNRGSFGASKAQGIGITTKLGADFQNFFIVADVGYHDLQLGSTSTSTSTDLGLAFGGDFKSWRFWFTYVASATISIDPSDEYTGDGMKLGMSGRLSNRAYVNLEFRFIDINDYNGSPTTALMDVGMISVSWKLL